MPGNLEYDPKGSFKVPEVREISRRQSSKSNSIYKLFPPKLPKLFSSEGQGVKGTTLIEEEQQQVEAILDHAVWFRVKSVFRTCQSDFLRQQTLKKTLSRETKRLFFSPNKKCKKVDRLQTRIALLSEVWKVLKLFGGQV